MRPVPDEVPEPEPHRTICRAPRSNRSGRGFDTSAGTSRSARSSTSPSSSCAARSSAANATCCLVSVPANRPLERRIASISASGIASPVTLCLAIARRHAGSHAKYRTRATMPLRSDLRTWTPLRCWYRAVDSGRCAWRARARGKRLHLRVRQRRERFREYLDALRRRTNTPGPPLGSAALFVFRERPRPSAPNDLVARRRELARTVL